MTAEKARAYRIAGFEPAEVELILDEPVKKEGDGPSDPLGADIPEPPAKPVSQPGDLWIMDVHRLLVGSSLDPASFEVLIAGRTATMVFQDAPYNVPIRSHVSGLGNVQH